MPFQTFRSRPTAPAGEPGPAAFGRGAGWSSGDELLGPDGAAAPGRAVQDVGVGAGGVPAGAARRGAAVVVDLRRAVRAPLVRAGVAVVPGARRDPVAK